MARRFHPGVFDREERKEEKKEKKNFNIASGRPQIGHGSIRTGESLVLNFFPSPSPSRRDGLENSGNVSNPIESTRFVKKGGISVSFGKTSSGGERLRVVRMKGRSFVESIETRLKRGGEVEAPNEKISPANHLEVCSLPASVQPRVNLKKHSIKVLLAERWIESDNTSEMQTRIWRRCCVSVDFKAAFESPRFVCFSNFRVITGRCIKIHRNLRSCLG